MSALLVASLLSAVTFVANGASTVTASATTCTPTMPGSCSDNDILFMLACGEGDDDGIGIALTTANGFASVIAEQSGDSGAGGEADPESNCELFWKRTSGGTCGSAPVVTDSGDHTTCAVHQFRGAWVTGNPWDVTAGGNDSNANDTSASIPGATTTVTNTLVVLFQSTSVNTTGTDSCGAATNADLANITEVFDSRNTQGLGGGHCVITGEKATASSYAATTLTLNATSYKAAFSVALKPEPVTDQQSMMGFW